MVGQKLTRRGRLDTVKFIKPHIKAQIKPDAKANVGLAEPLRPLFVYLPGMDGTGKLFDAQADKLSHWFDLRCLALPPQQRSDWPTLTHQVSKLISDELETESASSWDSRLGKEIDSELGRDLGRREDKKSDRRREVYLCGESFGGCLAMQVLAHSPHLFEKVILINPASSFRRVPWMQLGPLITHRVPNLVYRYGAQGLIPFLIEPFRVNWRDRVALADAMGSVPAKTAAWRMSLLGKFEAERIPLERMTHPVLIIVGGNDRLLPSKREAKSLVARFPNAKQVLLPESGHACLIESKTDLAQILGEQQFLPTD
ncbi:MAG: alpha/beta hydrolase [Cyanobacteria bacterium P01_D01_bin.1]